MGLFSRLLGQAAPATRLSPRGQSLMTQGAQAQSLLLLEWNTFIKPAIGKDPEVLDCFGGFAFGLALAWSRRMRAELPGEEGWVARQAVMAGLDRNLRATDAKWADMYLFARRATFECEVTEPMNHLEAVGAFLFDQVFEGKGAPQSLKIFPKLVHIAESGGNAHRAASQLMEMLKKSSGAVA